MKTAPLDCPPRRCPRRSGSVLRRFLLSAVLVVVQPWLSFPLPAAGVPVDAVAADGAEKAPPPQHYNLGSDRLALAGYDAVSYFTRPKPLQGRKELSVARRGVTYWFASEENRKLFTASPEKYLPAYGGWCATAMAKGEKVEVDPMNFKVTNGRLFLFYKGLWGNARKDWDKDEPTQTAKADAQWKKISGE